MIDQYIYCYCFICKSLIELFYFYFIFQKVINIINLKWSKIKFNNSHHNNRGILLWVQSYLIIQVKEIKLLDKSRIRRINRLMISYNWKDKYK